METKWKAEIDEYKVQVNQWKEKFRSEGESRHMLDDNLRILGRRVNDLELELTEKKEKVAQLERERRDL